MTKIELAYVADCVLGLKEMLEEESMIGVIKEQEKKKVKGRKKATISKI